MPKKHSKKRRRQIQSGPKGWNEKIEATLIELNNKSKVYTELHTQVAAKKQKRGRIIGIINVFATFALGTAIFGNTSYNSAALTIVTGIVAYLLTVSVALGTYLGYTESADEHKEASGNYMQISQKIQKQLDLAPEDRENAKDFVSWIHREFNSIHNAAPMLSPSSLAQFEKRYQSKLRPDFLDKDRLNDQAFNDEPLVDVEEPRSSGEDSFDEPCDTVFVKPEANNLFADAQARWELDRYYQK